MEKRDGENKDIEDDNMLKMEIEMKLSFFVLYFNKYKIACIRCNKYSLPCKTSIPPLKTWQLLGTLLGVGCNPGVVHVGP